MQFDTLPKNKKLFIFDLDGTVTDTEPCHFEAYRRTVEAFCPGQCVTEEEFLRCYVGHPETEIYALLKEKKHTDFDDAAFFRHRIDELFKIVAERGMKTAPFYRQLEAFFQNARFIALTSQRESVLDRFRETVDYGKITEYPLLTSRIISSTFLPTPKNTLARRRMTASYSRTLRPRCTPP